MATAVRPHTTAPADTSSVRNQCASTGPRSLTTPLVSISTTCDGFFHQWWPFDVRPTRRPNDDEYPSAFTA